MYYILAGIKRSNGIQESETKRKHYSTNMRGADVRLFAAYKLNACRNQCKI
jgi:hypothetical protein